MYPVHIGKFGWTCKPDILYIRKYQCFTSLKIYYCAALQYTLVPNVAKSVLSEN